MHNTSFFFGNSLFLDVHSIIERWSKFGHFGQSEGELQYPCYVTTDKKGRIYVSDMNSNKVQLRFL